MTDPITDMFNQIRNAQALSHPEVKLPFSDLKYNIAKLLEKENILGEVDKSTKKEIKAIRIKLKYEEGFPAISGFKRVSKPGRRIYIPFSKIKKVRSGSGLAVISTPKGLMTDKEARKNKIGGELMFEIW
jgi:small subunit ribosomal protein S8